VNISTALLYLQSEVAAAVPLNTATSASIRQMQMDAANLLDSIQTTLTTPGVLDNWTAPTDAASIISGFLNVMSACDDQQRLALMRGIIGRATSNLDQLV